MGGTSEKNTPRITILLANCRRTFLTCYNETSKDKDGGEIITRLTNCLKLAGKINVYLRPKIYKTAGGGGGGVYVFQHGHLVSQPVNYTVSLKTAPVFHEKA